MKNETGLHMLGWMILATVAESKTFAGVCTIMGIGYALISIYEVIRDWGKSK